MSTSVCPPETLSAGGTDRRQSPGRNPIKVIVSNEKEYILKLQRIFNKRLLSMSEVLALVNTTNEFFMFYTSIKINFANNLPRM